MTDHADTIRRALLPLGSGYHGTLAALDALLAERQQAQQERDIARAEWRAYSERETELMLEVDELREHRQQAIDALRRIEGLPRNGAYVVRFRQIARDALVKLGEKP